MNRSTRIERAQETLKIINDGYYKLDNQLIPLKPEIDISIKDSKLYKTNDFEGLWSNINSTITALDFQTTIIIENTSVLKAAQNLASKTDKIGCLNFASAKNPGGGFLSGAIAQEESLALSSTLYPTLMEHFEMYEYNRKRSTFLYSDYMIYSPDVLVFRNDEGELLTEPYPITFITSPAVNIGAIKNNRPEELAYAEDTMIQRMDKVLGLFVHHKIKHLLLGAWGCGVFQNNAEDVARYFAYYLSDNGKYSRAFESITFAVLDRSKEEKNVIAFKNAFDKNRLSS